MNDEKRALSTTTSGKPPEILDGPAPGPINPKTGMHTDYWILSAEERAKGFIRPVRTSYLHVGPPGPDSPLRDLTAEEKERYKSEVYVKFEDNSDNHSSVIGRF